VDRLLDHLRAVAAGAGLATLGVCRADPFDRARGDLRERADAGLHAGMAFTFADPDRSSAVRSSLPWAQRLVVAAHAYLPGSGSPGPARSGTGRIARFATTDHYAPLRAGLDAVAAALRDAGGRGEVLADDARLIDRAAAARAGVGWWGKNTMVLAPGAGPWLLLGSVVTDLELPVSAAMRRDCGACAACIPACPTGALIAPGVLDARRCLAYRAQAPGVIPRHLRIAMGDRLYGCDDCLEACPPGARALQEAPANRGRISLTEVLSTSDRALLRRFGHFYVPQRRARYLRRNALVALGNAGGRGAVAVAAGFAAHPDWLLRAHAVWALGRLGGPAAGAVLEARRGGEGDARVGAEIEQAVIAAAGTVA